MPLLRIETNQDPGAGADALAAEASRLTAESLGKAEGYVMVALEPRRHMMFAGSQGPAAFLQLKSIGLTEDRAPELSRSLCSLMEQRLGVPQDRVYIEFVDVPRAMWGWNGRTFQPGPAAS